MTEQATVRVSLPDRSVSVVLFPDDTIETVRMRVGTACGIHPDRLRIYVQTELPGDYYAKDPRKWETLFLRMSPEGKPIQKASLDLLAAHTDPSWELGRDSFDKSNWMLTDRKQDTDFQELRLLGVPEERAWILPLDNQTEPPFVPPAAKIGYEAKSMFKSLHPTPTTSFKVIPYEDGMRPAIELLYFPLLRAGSPAVVPDEVVRAIARQDELLSALSERASPAPSRQAVLRARWKIPLVETDFGLAPRNRFEQIFYGATVSKTVPAISFFGSRQEQSRHKYFTEDPANKKPSVDLRTWQYWWSATKPSKNRPSVLFYNGKGRFNYDRITVNSVELTVSAHRPDDSDETLESLQTHLADWVKSIDGLSAFLEPADLDPSRWVLQDVSASLKYPKELKEGDFRRFGCLGGIYEVVSHDKLLFKLLRADQADIGLSPTELRVLQILRENEATAAPEIAEDLGISVEEAGATLALIQDKLADNPDLLDRQFANLPTFRFTASNAILTFANDLPRVVRYINLLRDILMNPDDPTLDDICPARMEAVDAAVAEAAPPVEEAPAGDDAGLDFLDELLGEIAEANAVAAPVAREPAAPAPAAKKVAAKAATTTLATYLLTRLREFDPDTYDPDDPQILRKCDKPRQPIILSATDMERLTGGPYDPNTNPAAVLDVNDPDGHVICPAFWCTQDNIPLTQEQLDGNDGKCPVCNGKVRSTEKAVEKTQDIVEYPVLSRDTSIVFPGYVKYKSKKNGRQVPCCFTTAQTTKVGIPKPEAPSAAEAFYVLGESKARLGAFRLGYIPEHVGKALGIPLNYKETIAAGNRIQSGQSGMYRVGVGYPSETLPKMLGLPVTIKSPLEQAEATMRCSFFRTWKGADEEASEEVIPATYKFREKLAARVASIDKAFKQKTLTPLEELEYAALVLDCNLFVLYVTPDSVEMGCFMTIGAVRGMGRAIAVLVGESGDPEYVSHVARVTTTPQFTANLFKSTLFPPAIVNKLTMMRVKACTADIPSIDVAFLFLNSIPELAGRTNELRVVMDPYVRAQALFLPGTLLLPVKPTASLPTFLENRITGYADIPPEEYPTKEQMLAILERAKVAHAGWTYAHDVGTRDGTTVELVTSSGLRIPVRPGGESTHGEILRTVATHGEEALVWGSEDPVQSKEAKAITYEAEVFDFLLYQLSYDIQNGDDYKPLRDVLSQPRPNVGEVKPLLHDWMDETLTFSEADTPSTFVRKMRSPCTDTDCTGNMCAWNGASCRVEVKQVRPTLERSKLEKRLLSTLVSNEKIRSLVWQHRMSPFFSSVLYMELPTEVILSDADVARRLRV